MKYLALGLAFAGLSTFAHASYELGLVLQGNQIKRFDPVTNSYLGAVTLVTTSGSSLTSYRSTGQAYVLNSNQVYRYNYSTGEYMGRFNLNPGATTINRGMNDNEIVVGYSDHVERRDLTTGLQVGVNLSYGSAYTYGQGALAMRANGIYYLNSEFTGSGTDFLIGMDANNTLVGYYQINTAFASTTTNLLAGDVSGTNVLVATTNPSNNSFAPVIATKNPSDNNLTTTFGSSSAVSMAGGQFRDYIAWGHADSTIFLSDFNNTWAYYRSHPDQFFTSTSQPMSFLDNTKAVNGFSMILAPEPGIWAALGLGSLALLRRRRHRA